MCSARLEGQQSLMKVQHSYFTSLIKSNMNELSAILLFFQDLSAVKHHHLRLADPSEN